MHRFYLPPEQASGPVLTLTNHEAHHALHVLRIRPRDTVTILDGAGGQSLCEVENCARDHLVLRVLERHHIPRLPYDLTLVQALPKGKIIESIIQKATELGVARVVPLLTERVVAQFDSRAGAAKADKWQGVAIEAIKQCGSAWLPKIADPITPRQLVEQGRSAELALVASLQENARHPRECFREFETTHRRRPASVSVWIGPEGDFTADELGLAQSTGALPMTLGRLVLRTETAAIYCLSIINYEMQSSPLAG